jgi:hypothetical protein
MGDERRVAQPGEPQHFLLHSHFKSLFETLTYATTTLATPEIHRIGRQSPGYQGRRDVSYAIPRTAGIPLEGPGRTRGVCQGERERSARKLALVSASTPVSPQCSSTWRLIRCMLQIQFLCGSGPVLASRLHAGPAGERDCPPQLIWL